MAINELEDRERLNKLRFIQCITWDKADFRFKIIACKNVWYLIEAYLNFFAACELLLIKIPGIVPQFSAIKKK